MNGQWKKTTYEYLTNENITVDITLDWNPVVSRQIVLNQIGLFCEVKHKVIHNNDN